MKRRYTNEETATIFNVVSRFLENNEALRAECKRNSFNPATSQMINELKKYIQDRTDDALIMQVRLVNAAIYEPDSTIACHTRAVKYRQLYEQTQLRG
jgi:hypothetical protein